MEAFYKRWYAPNNAILVLAGDITVDEARELAERYYGPIPANPDLPERVRHAPQPMRTDATITMRDPQVERPSWVRSTPMPENMLRIEPESYALTVLQNLMTDGASSRLRKSLVLDNRIANSIAIYASARFNAGAVTLLGEPTDDHTVEDLEAAIDAEIAKLLEEGVAEAEVKAAQERLLASAIFARDGLSGPARTVGSNLVNNYTIEDLENWAIRIAAVTPELVNKVAKQVFNQQRTVTGILLPIEEVEPVQ